MCWFQEIDNIDVRKHSLPKTRFLPHQQSGREWGWVWVFYSGGESSLSCINGKTCHLTDFRNQALLHGHFSSFKDQSDSWLIIKHQIEETNKYRYIQHEQLRCWHSVNQLCLHDISCQFVKSIWWSLKFYMRAVYIYVLCYTYWFLNLYCYMDLFCIVASLMLSTSLLLFMIYCSTDSHLVCAWMY